MMSDLFVIHCGGYGGLEVSELEGSLDATDTSYVTKPTIPNVSRIAAGILEARKAAKRLALSFFLCQEILFSRGNPRDIMNEIKKGIVASETRSLRVRVIRFRKAIPSQEVLELERNIGEALCSKIGATVDLQNPESEFVMYVTDEGSVFGKKLEETARNMLKWRTNKAKPFKHPSTLQPDLSRALVNIGRVKPGDLVLDPYCGVGGILLEVAEVGAMGVGLDFKERMLLGARGNLIHYGHAMWHVVRGDARKPPFFRADRIVTDPPYGRLSPRIGGSTIGELHDSLVSLSAQSLPNGGYLSLICPSDMPIDAKLKQQGFQVLSLNELRVHGSLSRTFVSARR